MKNKIDVSEEGIIPPYLKIKDNMLNSFFSCNQYLKHYRGIILEKKPLLITGEAKERLWVAFLTELVALFFCVRTTLKSNPKTKNLYDKLKFLESKAVNIQNISQKEAIALFFLLEEALYEIGLLNVSVKETDAEDTIQI